MENQLFFVIPFSFFAASFRLLICCLEKEGLETRLTK